MKNESQDRNESIFHAACARARGREREAYLQGACGEDAELRSRVDALLAAHDASADFLSSPAIEGSPEQPGSMIGPYKLLQEIGEGGMGVVYMAEQETPVRRKVAVKVIKLGMDTKQVIARFEAERQALAMMDHANIARVLDAGSTQAGRPYFVMELVRGVPINEYCDTQKLPTVDRLALFIEVCRAVQHAHQKGIIHRDLKPTNVLVTSHDGTPVTKIIDFGVAKATNQKLTERTLFTEFHQVIGTPEYMSPEQAEMSGLDVDTRSDIYALGVLLYQLLTGTTPVDPKDLRTAGFQEMTRMIREDEPQAPSTRISKLGAAGERIANSRGSDAGSLSRNFRGELDWIVMKALEKDRTRRYETASDFAADLVRHLEDRPVEAGPPGAVYRVRKFAHRNRKAVGAALALLAVLGLGLAGTTAGFLRARAEADRSGKIGASLQDVLAMTDPARGADRSDIESVLATVREVFGENHATYAAVLDTLASQLHDAGDFEAAAELCSESLDVWKKVYGDNHSNVATALARLGRFLRAQGDDEQAENALREALSIFNASSDTPGFAGYEARIELADLLSNRGEYAEADDLLGESLAILRASPSPAHFRILDTLETRAVVQSNRQSEEARVMLRETMRQVYDETHEFYPEDSPLLAISALGYGRTLFEHDTSEAAEPYLREAIQRFRTSTREKGFYFVSAADALFQIMRNREDEESVLETNELLGELIEVGRKYWGANTHATTQLYYASRLHDRGRIVDALEAVLDGYQVFKAANRTVDEREQLRDSMTMLAFKAVLQSDRDPAVYARAREAAELAVRDEPEHPAMLVTLGAALYRLGEFELAAEKLALPPKPLKQSRGGLAREMAPGDHVFRAMCHAKLGHHEVAASELELLRALLEHNKADERAQAMLREVEAVVEAASPSTEDDENP